MTACLCCAKMHKNLGEFLLKLLVDLSLDRFEQVSSIKILTESPLRVIISKDKCVPGFVRRDEILRAREVFYYGTY